MASAHTSRRRSRLAGAALLITAALSLSSCAGGGTTNFADEFSVKGAVAQLPAQESDRYTIVVGDAEQALALADADPTSDDALSIYAGGSDNGVFLPPDDLLILAQSPEDALGWGRADVTRYASVSAPPDAFTVVAGKVGVPQDFDEVAPGIVSDSTADDYSSDLQRGDLLDRLRRPTRVAHNGDLIALTLSTKAASAWANSDGKTLLDNTSVATVADVLDKAKVYAAVMTQPSTFSGRTLLGPQASDAQAKAAEETYRSMVPPDPYDVVGIGWTGSGTSAKWIVAYHFTAEQAAKDGAQVLKGVWEAGSSLTNNTAFADMVSVDSVTIDGETVIVTLSPREGQLASTPYYMLLSLEIVFASR